MAAESPAGNQATGLAEGSAGSPQSVVLPRYADSVGVQDSSSNSASQLRDGLRFLLLGALGVVLFALPILTGMFTRAAGGQQMLTEFKPFVNQKVLAKFRSYLDTIEAARTDVQATKVTAGGNYEHLDTFVAQYPSIKQELTRLLNAVDGQVGNYQTLRAIGPFDALPFLLAVPGLVLVIVGYWGWQRNRQGASVVVARVLAALAAAVLIVVPFADGLWTRAPAGAQLLDAFAPIITHGQVATLQRQFVVLVAAEGELDARFLADLHRNDPSRATPGVQAFVSQWQPMTADFASFIGVIADNIDNFQRVAALDRITAPIGLRSFDYFGWFYLVPGCAAAALSLSPKGALRWRAK